MCCATVWSIATSARTTSRRWTARKSPRISSAAFRTSAIASSFTRLRRKVSFQAKLRYWSGGQWPAASGPSVTEDSCRPETGTRAARSGSARIPRQKEWAYDPSLAPDRCADPRGIVHRLRSGDRRPCRRGHFEAGDILHRRRADFSSEVSGVSSAELHRADVAHHLPGRTALGAIDQGARRDAADAAVAYRPQRRRAEIQERHVAQR